MAFLEGEFPFYLQKKSRASKKKAEVFTTLSSRSTTENSSTVKADLSIDSEMSTEYPVYGSVLAVKSYHPYLNQCTKVFNLL